MEALSIPTLLDAAKIPSKGSIVDRFGSEVSSKKEFDEFMQTRYAKKLGPILIDTEVDTVSYLLFSLVMKHSDAVDAAVAIQNELKDMDSIAMRNAFRSSVLGLDTSSPENILLAIRRVLRRYDKLVDFIYDLARDYVGVAKQKIFVRR